jgi:NitT/TauT family transport system substrate-binding protein
MKQRSRMLVYAGMLGVGVGVAVPAQAAETVKVAIGHMGLLWNSIVTMVGQKKGFFKAEGIKVERIGTKGGSSTIRAITAGGNNIGIANGTLGVIAAYRKGLPVRIISSEMIGTGDIYWIVKTDSPLKKPRDVDGHILSYSRPGSSTNMAALSVAESLHIKPKLLSVGGPTGARTQMMSGQIDTAWQAPPLGLKLVQEGKARILLKGNLAKSISDISIRVNIANAKWLAVHRDAATKYMRGRKKTLDWMFGKGQQEAIQIWSKASKHVTPAIGKMAADFYKRDDMRLAPLGNLDKVISIAVKDKWIKTPLTAAERKELVQILVK